MFTVTTHYPGRPTREREQEALNSLARANRDWYLAQWSLGNTPPRSAIEAGVWYRPAGPVYALEHHGAPTVFERGHASCGEVAAIWAGHSQAVAVRNGGDVRFAENAYRVHLGPGAGPDYWHGVGRDLNGQTIDHTRTMRRG